jgi:hypothetical protein
MFSLARSQGIGRFFRAGGIHVFVGGFGKNGWLGRGFLVVKTWWDAGERWCADSHFSGLKIMPLILDLFLGVPVLGRVGDG